MRTFAIAASVAALALSLVGPASADPIIIKFSHVVATDTPKGKGAEKFKELAEKYTGGKVKVEVYPNSTLYKDKEELEALQLGSVQMLAPSNSKFGPLGIREFEVFDLPYILPDLKTLRKVTEGPLGSLPQVMAFSEVYQALQTGVVDGQENTWSNIYTQKMHEVQKYITETNHGYIGYVVIVNKKFWDDLPADIRDQLSKAMKEATDFNNAQSQKENDGALAEIKKSGKSEIIKLTGEQDEAMRKAMEPVYKDAASRVGQPLIDEFLKEAKSTTN
ncbi:TRAP transporter substrate-binding protein DctP [Bradyrhizobium sp. LMG 9283]|uniref:TRAP transporter substrate-binding protein DctP n=1 Tax=Bradyrhizobium sp. LMG 9283 TaxID=592064 RepID=UPI00388F26ED